MSFGPIRTAHFNLGIGDRIMLGRVDAQFRQCREPGIIQFHADHVRLTLVEWWEISEDPRDPIGPFALLIAAVPYV